MAQSRPSSWGVVCDNLSLWTDETKAKACLCALLVLRIDFLRLSRRFCSRKLRISLRTINKFLSSPPPRRLETEIVLNEVEVTLDSSIRNVGFGDVINIYTN